MSRISCFKRWPVLNCRRLYSSKRNGIPFTYSSVRSRKNPENASPHKQNDFKFLEIPKNENLDFKPFSKFQSPYPFFSKLPVFVQHPTPIQNEAAKYFANSRNYDLILDAPTGSGKTYAYLLPMLSKIDRKLNFAQAIIICPNRELTAQVYRTLKPLIIHGSKKYKENPMRLSEVHGLVSLRKKSLVGGLKPHIIIGTPHTILELALQKAISFKGVHTVVIDEADQVLENVDTDTDCLAPAKIRQESEKIQELGHVVGLQKLTRENYDLAQSYLIKVLRLETLPERRWIISSAYISQKVKDFSKAYMKNVQFVRDPSLKNSKNNPPTLVHHLLLVKQATSPLPDHLLPLSPSKVVSDHTNSERNVVEEKDEAKTNVEEEESFEQDKVQEFSLEEEEDMGNLSEFNRPGPFKPKFYAMEDYLDSVTDAILIQALIKKFQPQGGLLCITNLKNDIPDIINELYLMGRDQRVWELSSNTEDRVIGQQIQENEDDLRKTGASMKSIIIGTDLAGRGLNLETVTDVVNLEIPSSIIEYIHRAGRAGRLRAMKADGTAEYYKGNVYSLIRESDEEGAEKIRAWTKELGVELKESYLEI